MISKEIVTLLGEKNIEKVKIGITNLILKGVENDIETWDSYLFYPPDMESIIEEAIEECKEEVKKILKEEMLKRAMQKLDL